MVASRCGLSYSFSPARPAWLHARPDWAEFSSTPNTVKHFSQKITSTSWYQSTLMPKHNLSSVEFEDVWSRVRHKNLGWGFHLAFRAAVRPSGSQPALETAKPITWPSLFEPRMLACSSRGMVGWPQRFWEGLNGLEWQRYMCLVGLCMIPWPNSMAFPDAITSIPQIITDISTLQQDCLRWPS